MPPVFFHRLNDDANFILSWLLNLEAATVDYFDWRKLKVDLFHFLLHRSRSSILLTKAPLVLYLTIVSFLLGSLDLLMVAL